MNKRSFLSLIILIILGLGCRPISDSTLATPWQASITPTISRTPTNTTEIASPPFVDKDTPTMSPNELISPIDGMPQVYVPAGNLRMGGLDIHADKGDELPVHTVSFDEFWIDKLELTNAMYMLCVQAETCSSPKDWATNTRPQYFNVEAYKDYPVVHVTWEQANIYCSWANRRLPTEAEWERAARGDDFRNFPWGDEPASDKYVNFNNLVGDTSRVGSYTAGASPFGALDLAGNIWEWVFDLYANEYYKNSPEHNPLGPETNNTYQRVIRGGSYQDGGVNLRVSKRGSALGPNPNARYDDPNRNGEHSSKIGFRCLTSK